ncbi:hypothetical protein [Rhizobium ruizarguesonis]|nr:hypothetical protein [Rhizobium ruizarguesonis]
MTDDAKYAPTFDWNRAVQKAVTSTDARAQFGKEPQRAIAKLPK